MTAVAVAIFIVTYALIASRRLKLLPIGRPAGALAGATLMVACGVLSPEQSFKAIDHDTILLLFAMMLVIAYLEMAGAFGFLSGLLERAGRTPRGLLTVTSLAAGVLSAVMINDTVCLALTPIVARLCLARGLPMGPYLIGIATSANIGSAATLVGNPQNMIIGSMSGYGFTPFLLKAGPAALAGLALNAAMLHAAFGRSLPREFAAAPQKPRAAALPAQARFVTIAALGIFAGFLLGFHLGYTALAGAVAIMLFQRKEPLEAMRRVDWSLLVFFTGLFIVVRGLADTGLVDAAWAAAAPHLNLATLKGAALFAAFMTIGSNLLSNVPMVMLTGPAVPGLGAADTGWILLAFCTTVAGNFTLLGSVANIIVAEQSRDHYSLGFWEYFRFGAVSTVVVLAAGIPIILAMQ